MAPRIKRFEKKVCEALFLKRFCTDSSALCLQLSDFSLWMCEENIHNIVQGLWGSLPVGGLYQRSAYIERMGEGKCLENLQYKIKNDLKCNLF